MGNIEKRISALEAGCASSEPVMIELVGGPTISREEADALAVPVPFRAIVTRIELVGVLPQAQIIRFNRPGA